MVMMANVKNVHGHSYKLSVTVIGSPIENRDNVKFEWLSILLIEENCKEEIVDQFDHATVLMKLLLM
jgi:6-pyruvoyltetrahydropterin/6-carboxytetrahydropterin synthase